MEGKQITIKKYKQENGDTQEIVNNAIAWYIYLAPITSKSFIDLLFALLELIV